MPAFSRVILLVLDSVGIGAMPDAAAYGDEGSDTLGHLAARRPLQLPFLQSLGLGNIRPLAGIPPAGQPRAAYGKCTLGSPGKDTTTGHWEMSGIVLSKPFPLFPHGFPSAVMEPFEERTGRGTLANKTASGTEIIAELGEEHLRTGKLIVYTSADSVFQVAAHEDVVPLEELYRACEIAREILTGEYEVGRVIARPFAGKPAAFRRTSNRHDYAVPPPAGMLLDQLEARGVSVHGIGKIGDIFLQRGMTSSQPTKGNDDGMRCVVETMQEHSRGLIFTNLVDFDSLYGHRNDIEGYASALEAVDRWLPTMPLAADDLMIVTADHGCDPTTASTDHSREYTPLLAWGKRIADGVNLGTRHSLADIGQTIAENFGTSIGPGASFLQTITT